MSDIVAAPSGAARAAVAPGNGPWMGWLVDAAPRRLARLAGLFFLLMVVCGGLAGWARNGVIVKGDAAATAANILAHASTFQLSFTGELLVAVCFLVVTAFMYRVFEPVSRSGALVAAFLSLAGCIIQGLAALFLLAPVQVLKAPAYLSDFTPGQLQGLAFLSLRVYSQTYGIALIFFSFYGVVIGYLAFTSTFLPRFVGALMMLGSLCWMTFLYPPLSTALWPGIQAGGVGEALLMLWLLIAGVNAERWSERARAVARPSGAE